MVSRIADGLIGSSAFAPKGRVWCGPVQTLAKASSTSALGPGYCFLYILAGPPFAYVQGHKSHPVGRDSYLDTQMSIMEIKCV